MSVPIDTSFVSASSGARLNVAVCAPPDPVAVVQMNHGLAEHANRYAAFQQFLAENNIASVAHDHRGHGQSTAPDASRGVFAAHNGYEAVIADAVYLHHWCQERWPNVPLVAFGHSMGGLIALNAALQLGEGLSGLAVWNSNLAPGALGRVGQAIGWLERKFSSPTAPAKMLPKLTFGAWDKRFSDEGAAFHWLSSDPREVQKYLDDPDCGFAVSTSLWSDVLRMSRVGENGAALAKLPKSLPIQLIGGGQDPATNGGKAVTTFANRLIGLGFSSVSVRIDPDARHETLNEKHRAVAMETFFQWLRANGLTGSR